MYSASFNIILSTENIVINTTPYLLVNEKLFNILYEIRRIISINFKNFAQDLGVPLHVFRFNLSIFDYENKLFHIFDINCNNIREMRILMKEEYPPEIYKKLFEN